MVTGASGNPVSDVNVSDVKLFENDVEQKVTYFAKKPVSNVAFVMDNTGSVRLQLNIIKALGNTIEDNLGRADEAMVIRFVGNDKITIEQPSTTDKAKVKKAFAGLAIEGGQSAVRDGVYLAAEKLLEGAKTKTDKRFAMILISDGEDRNSYYSEKDIFSLVRGGDVQIFIIGLTADLDSESGFLRHSSRQNSERFIHTLADRSGGAAYILSGKYKKEDLEQVVISLINELRSPFVIGYSSTNQKHDGEARKLRVEIANGPNAEKRTAVIRNSFTVPKY